MNRVGLFYHFISADVVCQHFGINYLQFNTHFEIKRGQYGGHRNNVKHGVLNPTDGFTIFVCLN